MDAVDRQARKQVLLTRIAFDRIELQRDLARVREAAHLPRLLRSLVGGSLGSQLFGGGASGHAGWVRLALSLLARYRVATALFAGVAPLLRRNRWRRLVKLGAIGAIGAAGWAGWRAWHERTR
jgi:hypothetical protein